MPALMKKLAKNIFADTYNQIQKEHKEFINSDKKNSFNRNVLIICIVVCLSLTFIEYAGKNDGYYLLISFIKKIGLTEAASHIKLYIEQSANHQLFSLGYWVFIILAFYFLAPALIIKYLFRQKLSEYGLCRGSLFKEYRLYLLFFVIMVPLILFFSTTDGFQQRYPFYRIKHHETLWPNFVIWQVLYFFQFVALEFFFRGFMLHGLKKQFGYYSIFVMTIPYCMIHFGKPFPETLAAIIAGIVLGTISLKSRSIWMGVAIHYTVALSMDIAALWQKGYWFN